MTEDAIRQSLLMYGYNLWLETGGQGFFLWEEYASQQMLNVTKVAWCMGGLLEENIFQTAGPGTVVMSAEGALWMEKVGLASTSQIEKNNKSRTTILDTLDHICQESGSSIGTDCQLIYEKSGLDEKKFGTGFDILEVEGFVKRKNSYLVTITSSGLECIKSHRVQAQRTNDFQCLQAEINVTPQARGHKLEDLLTNIIKDEGWATEQNVRTPGEEHDIVIYRELEYYLIECKWESSAIQPKYLTVLQGRVSRRPGMRGVFISMSDYTDEAIKDSIEVLQLNTILLYGLQDIAAIMAGQATFTSLLKEKSHAAMLHRAIVLNGKHHNR